MLTPFGMAPTRNQCPFMCTRDVQVLGQNWSSEVIYAGGVRFRPPGWAGGWTGAAGDSRHATHVRNLFTDVEIDARHGGDGRRQTVRVFSGDMRDPVKYGDDVRPPATASLTFGSYLPPSATSRLFTVSIIYGSISCSSSSRRQHAITSTGARHFRMLQTERNRLAMLTRC